MPAALAESLGLQGVLQEGADPLGAGEGLLNGVKFPRQGHDGVEEAVEVAHEGDE